MNAEIIQKLLKKIHHYYPIGFSHIYNEYDGAKELYQLIGEKIDKVVNQQNQEWLMFLKDVHKETEKIIFNESYLQFPNYVFHIKLLEEFPAVTQKHELVRTNKNIVACFSLLVPYYTIYFQTDYRFEGYRTTNNTPKLMGHKIIHSSTNEFEETLKQKIEEKAKYHFENYEGLPYKFLFQNKITGCNNMYGSPFSIDQNEHSFFDYLFSNHLGGLDFIVI